MPAGSQRLKTPLTGCCRQRLVIETCSHSESSVTDSAVTEYELLCRFLLGLDGGEVRRLASVVAGTGGFGCSSGAMTGFGRILAGFRVYVRKKSRSHFSQYSSFSILKISVSLGILASVGKRSYAHHTSANIGFPKYYLDVEGLG